MQTAAVVGAELVVADRSDPGCDPTKQVNEDACGHAETPLGHVLVVCDGMGGHARGAEASRLAVATVIGALARAPAGSSPRAALARAIEDAGREVFRLAERGPGRPGSTCVALLVHAGGAEIAHVGDSRAHLVRAGRAWPLTRDHSIVRQLVDAGALRPEDARAHPDAGKITRALGLAPDVEVDARPQPLALAAEDRLVLASDGLTDLVTDDELATEAAAPDPAAACERLVAIARARGAPDNVTVQIARVVRPGAAQAQPPAAAAGLGRTVLAGEAVRTEVLAAVVAPAGAAPTVVDDAPPATVRAPLPSHDAGVDRAERQVRWMIGAAAAIVLATVLGAAVWWATHEQRPQRHPRDRAGQADAP